MGAPAIRFQVSQKKDQKIEKIKVVGGPREETPVCHIDPKIGVI